MPLLLVVAALVTSELVLNDAEAHTPKASEDPTEQTPASESPTDAVGLHLGINLGVVALDLSRGRFYGVLSGSLGLPVLSRGTLGAFAAAAGYSIPFARSPSSAWVFDLLGVVPVGWEQPCGGPCSTPTMPFVGVGVGVGFRFLHRSGFVLGFKVPVFGISFGRYAGTTLPTPIYVYYLTYALAVPVISVGLRF